MEKLSIVYDNADYDIRYEKKERVPFRHKNEVIKLCCYSVYFGDRGLQEQFGNPFEFVANIWKKMEVMGILENSAQWRMANAILNTLDHQISN